MFLLSGYGYHRASHVLTHSFPQRRSSDLAAPSPERHPACGTHVADQDRLPFATLWPRISGRDLSDRDVLRPGILTVRLPAKSTGKRAYMLTPIYAASEIGRAHV